MELTLTEGCWMEFGMATPSLENVVLLRAHLVADDIRHYYARWRLEDVLSRGHL